MGERSCADEEYRVTMRNGLIELVSKRKKLEKLPLVLRTRMLAKSKGGEGGRWAGQPATRSSRARVMEKVVAVFRVSVFFYKKSMAGGLRRRARGRRPTRRWRQVVVSERGGGAPLSRQQETSG